MALKGKDDRVSKGANTLSDDEIEVILGTVDFFGGDYRQDFQDLSPHAKARVNGKVMSFAPRYRVFDWLAMRVRGRHSGTAADEQATKVLAYSFIKSGGVVSKFIEDLRVTDYDIDDKYQEVEL